jgi:CheY-like chemotaxis protein
MALLKIREIRRYLGMIDDSVSFFFQSSLLNPELNIYHSLSSNTNIESPVTNYSPPPTPSTITVTAESTTTTNTPHATSNNKRILIVDDEKDIARFFKIALERAGFIVDMFNDPLISLSNYKAGVYDLLLLDIRMPNMSGFELYNKIKEIDDKVKVCFITAYEEYYDEFKKQFPYLREIECYIRKPIGIEDLIRTVKSRLNYN